METEPWTTALGRQLLALENGQGDYAEICYLEDSLKYAFNALKHIRKCYNKETNQ